MAKTTESTVFRRRLRSIARDTFKQYSAMARECRQARKRHISLANAYSLMRKSSDLRDRDVYATLYNAGTVSYAADRLMSLHNEIAGWYEDMEDHLLCDLDSPPDLREAMHEDAYRVFDSLLKEVAEAETHLAAMRKSETTPAKKASGRRKA